MSDKEQQNDEVSSLTEDEMLTDKIVEETMKEIYDSLAAEEAEKKDAVKDSEKSDKKEPEVQVVSEKTEEIHEEKPKKQRDKKKIGLIAGSIVGAVLIIYLGISLFFINHFYFGTTINEVSFSGKTPQDVENYIDEQVSKYVLTLSEKDGKTEQIKGTDIELKYKNGKDIQKALKKQNPVLWITAFFGNKSEEVVVEVDYNKEKLDQMIASLEALKEENQVAPVSAKPVFNGEQFAIEEEVYGTLIDKEKFLDKVHEHVGHFKSELDLEKEDCYVQPKFKKNSPEVAMARDTMNTYTKANITYSLDSGSEVVNKSLISQWLTVDADMNVTFSTDAVGAYVDELCNKYNTVGKVRSITTPTGKKAEVSGGTYGWKIDRDAEYTALLNSIKAGETVTREPAYAQKAASHGGADWGSTYLEVDLSAQHMWYVQNGAVAFQADVITGRPTPKRRTPQGVYTILEKLRNKTLVGEIQPNGKPEYETPVSYWMRVTWSGIGFHDATWQPGFGGNLYQTIGSHGCINMSLNEVSQLYGMVNTGCPVVVHY